MKLRVRFFWYNDRNYHDYRWGMRGIAFTRGSVTVNVHYKSLAFLYGMNWRVKLLNARRAWKTLLTLGLSEHQEHPHLSGSFQRLAGRRLESEV